MGLLLLLLFNCATPHVPIDNTIHDIAIMESFAIGKPQQRATWGGKPSIRICDSTRVSVFRVKKAVAYWNMLGYEFDMVFMDYKTSCGEPRYGEIAITLPTKEMSPNHLASTRIYTEKITAHIAKAKIFIYPKDARKQRVIEHELGHALGWQHYPQKFHIMHPNWHAGGYDATGLRKKR